MHTIKYLGFSSLDPYLNMSIDTMLFDLAQQGKPIATLRFFKFNKPCVSIGKNQDIHSLPKELVNKKLEIVRRPTGGGAVLHNQDICYSLVIPEDYLGKNKSLLHSYGVISDGLKMGFESCGVNVEFGTGFNKSTSSLCFSTALSYELTINGKKLVGSAQRRAKGILLQQGSVMNEHHIPQDKLIECLMNGLKVVLNVNFIYASLSEIA